MNQFPSEIKSISYVLIVPSIYEDDKRIRYSFEDIDSLQARDSALNLALQQREKLKNYRGIQLTICYFEKNSNNKYRKKRFNILTGWRMGSEKILKHLNIENNILQNANVTFPKMVTDFENKEYLSVNQHFNSLNYFTFE